MVPWSATLWSAKKAKTIPKEHWEYKLVTSDSEGIYKFRGPSGHRRVTGAGNVEGNRNVRDHDGCYGIKSSRGKAWISHNYYPPPRSCTAYPASAAVGPRPTLQRDQQQTRA